jgi:restriction endonuclease S subunit
MTAWPTKSFRDIFKLKQGKYLANDEMVEAPFGYWNVPVYGANGIIGYSNRVMFKHPVPLVSCRGANCGVTHLTEARSWVSNNSIACISSEVEPRFFYHVFRVTSFSDVTGGSAQPQITLTSLGPKQIIFPPLETQRRIASILRAYDDLIEVNRRRVAVLEEMARGLFEEWFIRFRFPGHEAVPITDAPEGRLPEGWSFAPLDEIAEVSFGFPFKSKAFSPSPEGSRVVRIRDVPEGITSTWTTEAIRHTLCGGRW